MRMQRHQTSLWHIAKWWVLIDVCAITDCAAVCHRLLRLDCKHPLPDCCGRMVRELQLQLSFSPHGTKVGMLKDEFHHYSLPKEWGRQSGQMLKI